MQEVNMSNISPCWGDLFKTDVGIGELLTAACDSSMYFFFPQLQDVFLYPR